MKKLVLFVVLAAIWGSAFADSTVPGLTGNTKSGVTRRIVLSIPGARVAAERSKGSLNGGKVGLGAAIAAAAVAFTGDAGPAVAIQKSGTTGAN